MRLAHKSARGAVAKKRMPFLWGIVLGLLLFGPAALPASFAQPSAPETPKPELIPQTGHTLTVTGAAFSPNGRLLATGSIDETIVLWEVATGRELRTLRGHTWAVADVAFSPDGRFLASGSADKTVKLWDVASGRELRTFTGHSRVVELVVFSPDSRSLASGSADHTIKLWGVATGRELRTLVGHTGSIAAIAFSPDGSRLISGGEDQTVKLWDIASGQCIRTWAAHAGEFTSVAFSTDGRWVAAGSANKTVKLWDMTTEREAITLPGHTEGVNDVAFSPDSRSLASVSSDNTVKLWEVATGREIRTIVVPADQTIRGVVFSPDGRWLVSVGRDANARLWDVATGRQERTFAAQARPGLLGWFSLDGQWLSSESAEGTGMMLKLMELSTAKVYEMVMPFPPASLAKGEPPLGQLAAAFQFFQSHGVQLPGLNFSTPILLAGRAEMIAYASTSSVQGLGAWAMGNTIHLLDITSSWAPRSLATHTGGVSALTISPDRRLLASAGKNDKTVKIWEIATGHELWSLTAVVNWGTAMSFSPDGRWLAAGSENSVQLWEVSTGRETWAKTNHSEEVRSVAFSPDGHWLASGSNNAIKLWDAATGQEVRTLVSPTSFVIHVAFSPDGRWLVSTSTDGATRLWDPKSGKEVALLVYMTGSNDWLAVTPDGLFDGTEQGMQKLVAWRIGNHVYPPDKFFADYYTPGLLTRIFAGERPKPKVDIANLKLPPEVRVTSPGSGTLKNDHVAVAVEANDQGGGISEVRLFQNGKLVGTRDASHDPHSISGTYAFEVELVPGENLLRAIAVSRERVESNEDAVRIVLDVPEVAKPVLHLLVVGINRYEDPALNLNYARQDGEALALFFQQHGQTLFSSVDVVPLFDEKATQANVRVALEKLVQQAKPEDVVFVYLAGHGVGLEQQFYFLPHEMHVKNDDEAAVRRYGISAVALGDYLRRIRALKQVLILDACQSETALPILAKLVTFRGLGNAERKATQMLARSNGVYLIAASTKQQYAAEVPELHHGVLTYALLSGLGDDGKPQAQVSSEGMVTVLSLLQYVNQTVPDLTEKYQHTKQYPVSFNTGMDFPLTLAAPSH